MLLIFSVVSFFTNTPNYPLIRQVYQKAITSESHVSTLKNLTETYKNSDAIAKAFYATAQAFEAKNAAWVSTKVKYAKIAYAHLIQSVLLSPNNVEIRFLRFSFESNTPSILGMRNHIQEDKEFLLKNTKSTEPLWTIMKSFYQNCADLTASERESLITR